MMEDKTKKELYTHHTLNNLKEESFVSIDILDIMRSIFVDLVVSRKNCHIENFVISLICPNEDPISNE